jgi:hypothetical protein
MSALPPKADISERRRHVRFVPLGDKVQRSKISPYDHSSSKRQGVKHDCEFAPSATP